jgi:hypothetical protein
MTSIHVIMFHFTSFIVLFLIKTQFVRYFIICIVFVSITLLERFRKAARKADKMFIADIEHTSLQVNKLNELLIESKSVANDQK